MKYLSLCARIAFFGFALYAIFFLHVLTGCTTVKSAPVCYYECWDEHDGMHYCWWHNTQDHMNYLSENSCLNQSDQD